MNISLPPSMFEIPEDRVSIIMEGNTSAAFSARINEHCLFDHLSIGWTGVMILEYIMMRPSTISGVLV